MNLLQAVDRPDLIDPQLRLLDQNKQPHQCESNKVYIQQYLAGSVLEKFPNLNKVQVEAFVLKLFNTCYEWQEFKGTVRDLLVSMKQLAAVSDEFYVEEKKEALEKAS